LFFLKIEFKLSLFSLKVNLACKKIRGVKVGDEEGWRLVLRVIIRVRERKREREKDHYYHYYDYYKQNKNTYYENTRLRLDFNLNVF
jgi:hypothetical protein